MIKNLTIILVCVLVVAACSRSSEEYFELAKKMERADKTDRAIMFINKSIAADSNNTEAILYLATLQLEIGHFSEAIETMHLYEKQGGDKVVYYENTGKIYEEKLLDLPEALEYYVLLVDVIDNPCPWLNYIGNTYYRLNERFLAKEYFLRAGDIECLDQTNMALVYELNYNYKYFSHAEHKVSLKHPEYWKVKEEKMPEMYFYQAVEEATGINLNLTVASDQNAPLSMWKTMIDSQMAEEGVEILKNEKSKVNGNPCNWVEVRHSVGENSVILNNLVMIKNGNMYSINYTTPEDLYELYSAVQNAIIGSIAIE